MRHRYVLLLAGLLILFATPVLAQSLIHVPSDMGLQPAIEAVSDGGIIEIAAGTYAAPVGSGFAIADKAKRFTIRAASGATVVLDGAASTFIFRFINSSLAAGRPVTFEGLTFNNGVSTTDGLAGGITLQRAQGTFLNCKFTNNNGNATNVGGGAVLVGVGSTAFFFQCLWQNNRATAAGSAIEIGSGSKVFVHDSEFLTNRTNFPNHSHVAAGGAIHMGDSVLGVTNSRFIGNESGYVGGAIYAIGTWADPVTTPAAEVTIADCYFQDNKAKRDPSVTDAFPTEGGAFHAEDQTTARIYNSRFVNNQADTGGAVNLFRSEVDVRKCVFEGNTTLGGSIAFGGTLNAISSDGNDATTNFGLINRRSAKLTMVDDLVRGRVAGQTVIPNDAGCLFVAGDGNRQYGENGVTQMGTLADNQAVADLTRTVFYDCDSQGVGGAIETALASLTLTDSIAMSSNATLGAGLAALNQSTVTLTNSTFAKNVATQSGGAIFIQGSTLNMSGSRLVANTATTSGAAIYSEPDDARNLKVTGLIQTTTMSESTGSWPIYESDRNDPARINDLQYNANVIPNPALGIYVNDQVGLPAKTVSQLNSLVVTRTGGAPSTIKSPAGNNTAPASNPIVGQILAVPPEVLAAGAHNETGPFPSYLGYAWGGAATVTLNGASRSGNIGLEAATTTGTQTLVVGASSFTASVGNAATPSASLVANPTTISGGTSTLSWSTPTGSFADGGIDQGVGRVLSSSGTTAVGPLHSTTYRYLAVTQEGGAEGSATVSVVTPAPVISSFTASPVLIRSGQSSLLSWGTSGATSVTLNGSAVAGTGSQSVSPGATTTYTLVATNGSGSASQAVTVNVNGGTAGLGAPVISAPGAGQVIGVSAVTFSWGAVSGAQGYDLRLFDTGTGQTVFSGSLSGGGSTSTVIQLPGGTFTFAVRACNGTGYGDGACGAYGTVGFTVNLISPSEAPVVTFPAQGANLTTSTQVLSWTTVTPNPALPDMKYEVVLRDVAGGTTALQTAVPHPSNSTVFSLKSSTNYELRVRACQAGCGPWSGAVTFSVTLPPVPTQAPTITSAVVTSGNLTVDWTAVAGADLYQVQVVQPGAGPGGGALTVAARQVSETTATFPVPVGSGQVVVAACTGDGCGPESPSVGINPTGSNPALPNLGTPMVGTVVSGPTVLFTWSRVPGDTGTNTTYRLYVRDFSRQDTALDVQTTSNFYGAQLKAEGTRYDAVVVVNPDGTGAGPTGPAAGFNLGGTSATAPTMVSPRHNSTVTQGNITLGWSPVPGATLYQYYVASGTSAVTGVTPGLFVQVPLTGTGGGTPYNGIVRACPAGATCVAGSDAGWGPWSNAPGGPGVTSFTVVP